MLNIAKWFSQKENGFWKISFSSILGLMYFLKPKKKIPKKIF